MSKVLFTIEIKNEIKIRKTSVRPGISFKNKKKYTRKVKHKKYLGIY